MKRVGLAFFVALELLACGCFGGCATAPLDFPRAASWAIEHPEQTHLGHQIELQAQAHPGQSGFMLLSQGPQSLSTRLTLIDAAERSIDLQYYLIADDLVGDVTIDHLVAAAQRGVRVRVLLDDWNLAGKDLHWATIGTCPGIEVRIFNPSGNPRSCPWTRPLHFAPFAPARIRKRMHNKALVVDNTAAIVGGRNIADEYFTALGDFNFIDIDLLAVGPVARQVSANFDAFWNDRLSVPIAAFVGADQAERLVPKLRRTLDAMRTVALRSPYPGYADALHAATQPDGLGTNRFPLVWAEAEALYDQPAKMVNTIAQNPAAYMVITLKQVIDRARSEVLLVSPYLIPGSSGMTWFKACRARGVTVKILTNSLASTDEVALHGAYHKYRADLLRWGVDLFELRPDPESQRLAGDGRADPVRATLHAKCLIVDRQSVFVGSYNFDLRSANIDTQNGIVVHSRQLAEQLAGFFAEDTAPKSAYRVQFRETESGKIMWTDDEKGKMIRYLQEPKTGIGRRLKASILSSLAPEQWL